MAGSLLNHVALVIAGGALLASGWRAAAALGAPPGLERAVAAVPLAAAAAVLEALVFGLVGLGGSGAVLLVAALATLALAAVLLPDPEARWNPLASWRALDAASRALLGALMALAVVWAAWLVKHPALAIDPLTYHLPESVTWVQDGSTGSIEVFSYDWPQGNYPVTNEVLVAWITGLGRSFAPSLLWTLAATGFGVAAAWLGLRCARVPRLASGLAIAAVLLVPVAVTQQLGPHTDLPALAWLVATAALALAAQREPRLLAPALVAAALAVGTKTTVGPLAAAALLAGAWQLRDRLRTVAVHLGWAAVVAVLCGGLWYARNLLQHGSPLWPFLALPGGDPVPPLIADMDTSLLDRPRATLEGRWDVYFDVLGGAFVLLAAIPIAWLIARTRTVALAATAAGLALLSWLSAPFTGAPPDPAFDLTATATRYLLPAVAASALALALAARDAGPTGRRLATGILAAASLLSLTRSLALPFPGMPPLGALVVGALAGAVVAYAAGTAGPLASAGRPRSPRARAALPLALLALLLAGGLTTAGHGFAARHGALGRLSSSGVVSWLAVQPGFSTNDAPVAFAPQALAVLAGDELRHPITVIPVDEPCREVRDRVRRGWVVIGTFPLADRLAPFTARRCLRNMRPRYRDPLFRVYSELYFRP